MLATVVAYLAWNQQSTEESLIESGARYARQFDWNNKLGELFTTP